MTRTIARRRWIESLKEAASWPGAERNTLVTLATALVAARADAEASDYFQRLADAGPDDATALALAGFFQVRAGLDAPAGVGGLDRAATLDLGLPQYFRGLALAELLARTGEPDEATGRAGQVITDLEFVLAVRDQFPPGLLRAAYLALARAYRALGKHDQAAAARRDAGLGQADADPQPAFTNFSVTARDGLRMSQPRALRPEPDIHVAQSYDFGDFAFVTTSEGIVAIDAGTSPDRVRAALADLGLPGELPITHLILTHAHFDHIGGAAALLGPDTQVITSGGFPAEMERQRDWRIPFRNFTGTGAGPAPHIEADVLVSERTPLKIGGTDFQLIPVRGGETPDALMVLLPASGLLFTGDVMMPYAGAPFRDEGSPEGLLDTLRYIRELAPRQLIQGHTPLTEFFTIEAIAGLEPALTQLREFVLARIGENMTLPAILDLGHLPVLLRDYPAAVVPYLVGRDNFTARLHHQRTGYWQPDGRGIEPLGLAERAAALDLLAGGRAAAFATAAATLAAQGDLALALEIIEPGLLRHPGDDRLAGLRHEVLGRLMEQYQLSDPFRFLIYAELTGAEVAPVG